MKLHIVVLAFYGASASGVKLVAREDTCSQDNCWRAVWGTDRGSDAPFSAFRDCMNRLTTTVATYTYPIATVTNVAWVTATAVVSCSTTLTSSTTSSPSSSASSLPGFVFPTPTSTPAEIAGKVKPRQNEVLSYSTTTIIGSIPTYVGNSCDNSNVSYASACSCKSITSSQINVNEPRTTLISTEILTLTSTVTSTAYCSSPTVITLSHRSSSMVTTITLTSSNGIGTVTGTISSSSSISISPSSSITFNTTKTPSSTLNSTTTTFNTTLTSSTIPTPTCATPGWILCNSTCLNPASDDANCGSCGNTCGTGLVCFNGVCARRPLDPPCDTNCTFRRECNRGFGPASCSCARDSDGYGICFDANVYQCLNETPKCNATTGCELGEFCVKSICATSSSCSNRVVSGSDQDIGICVTSKGCGSQGPIDFGALVRIGEQQQRKRKVGEFNW